MLECQGRILHAAWARAPGRGGRLSGEEDRRRCCDTRDLGVRLKGLLEWDFLVAAIVVVQATGVEARAKGPEV